MRRSHAIIFPGFVSTTIVLSRFAGAIDFEDPAKSEAVSGLVFQIATPASRYRYGESIDVHVRFTNVGAQEIHVSLATENLAGPGQLLNKVSDREGNPVANQGLNPPGLVLPPKSSVVLYLGEIMMLVGQHSLQYEYRYPLREGLPDREGVWQGTVKSNTVHVTVVDEPLDERQSLHLEERCRRLIASLKEQDLDHNIDHFDRVCGFLVVRAPYSVPVLRDGLSDHSETVRYCAVRAVGSMAGPRGPTDSKRDTSLLNELLAAYAADHSLRVKGQIAFALGSFADVMTERQRRVSVGVLRDALETDLGDSPKSHVDVWRENAVSSLLRVDPKTGVSLVVPMLLDGEFGEVSAGGVLQELEKVTGGRYYGKVQKLKEWWEKEHQDK